MKYSMKKELGRYPLTKVERIAQRRFKRDSGFDCNGLVLTPKWQLILHGIFLFFRYSLYWNKGTYHQPSQWMLRDRWTDTLILEATFERCGIKGGIR